MIEVNCLNSKVTVTRSRLEANVINQAGEKNEKVFHL